MSSLRFRRAVVGCAISFLNALAPDSALSLTIDCAERGASYRYIDSASGTLEFNVERNDALTWQAVTNGGSVDIDIGNGWQPAIAPGSYRVSNNATSFRIRVNGAGASGRVSCYPSNSPQNAGITTEIAKAPAFYYAEDYHQQYLAKNPGGYCGLGGTGVACPIGTGVTAG